MREYPETYALKSILELIYLNTNTRYGNLL
jgi:hypothetical protein